MLIGEFKHTLDSKKRLAIPAKFRKSLGKGAVVTRGLDSSLLVYSLREWAEMSLKLGKLPASQVEARGFARIMLAGAVQVSFDRLGRILIPDYLKTYAQLKKNIAIIGLYNRLEIWDEELWENYKKKVEREVGDFAGKLKELGI